jgi:outer membrane receptor protein involved in Fe transport
VGVTATGNPKLTTIALDSYDIRLEWFPNPGDLVSGGVFYKQLQGPVELIDKTIGVAGEGQITWDNREAGQVMGVEFEARKSLEFLSRRLQGLTLGVNASYIQSETKHTKEELANNPFAKETRPLYDQSPYIVNLDLNYEHPTSGTSLTIGANFTGERIVLATSLGEDVYEHPPVSLDAAISQKFWKHWTLRLAVKNILDPEYLQTLGAGYGGPVFQSYHRGRTYALTLTGEF